MQSFWAGFEKRAVENFVSANSSSDATHPGAPEKMLKWNDLGGVDPRTPEDMQAAQAVMLITLPTDVEGASCATCMHFRPITPKIGHGFCTNPEVKQDVAERMHCASWSHPGVHDPVAAAEEEAQAAQVDQAMMAQQGQGKPMDPAAAGGQPPEAAPAMGQAAPANPVGKPAAMPVQAPGGQRPEEMSEDAAGGTPAYQPSPVGTSTSSPLAQEAIDDFQGAATTAGPMDGGGTGPGTDAPKKTNPKKEKKSDSGHTINISVGKGEEKKASFSFWRGIVEGY